METNPRLDPRQRELAERMSELSELAYYASWMMDLEHALWRAVEEGPRSYGHLMIGEADVAELRRLSQDCGGWIVWDTEAEETWVPMADWLRRYDRRRGSG